MRPVHDLREAVIEASETILVGIIFLVSQAFSSMPRKTVHATFSRVNHVLFSQETLNNSERNLSLNNKYSRNYAASQPKPHDDISSNHSSQFQNYTGNQRKRGKTIKSSNSGARTKRPTHTIQRFRSQPLGKPAHEKSYGLTGWSLSSV